MNEDKTNKYSMSVEDKKKYISEKEHEISMSELRINNLKSICKKLESTQRKNERQKIISPILFHTVCNIVIFFLLVSYIMPLIKVFETASLSYQKLIIITINAGVLGISFLGAYAMSKTGKISRKKIDRKNLKIISQIQKQKTLLDDEIKLQETLKKEISIIMEELNTNKEDILSSQEKTSYYYNRERTLEDIQPKIINETSPYTRKKKKQEDSHFNK